jgi:hypothetical protein
MAYAMREMENWGDGWLLMHVGAWRVGSAHREAVHSTI